MKKAVSLVLATVLLVCTFPFYVFAQQDDVVDDAYADMYDNYRAVMDGWTWNHYFQSDSNFAFVSFSKRVDNSPFLQGIINFSLSIADGVGTEDFFVDGNSVDSADQVEIGFYEDAILSLLMTMEQEVSGSLEQQAKADATMTFEDYVTDATSATVDLIGPFAGDISEAVESVFLLLDGTVGALNISTAGLEAIQTKEQYEALSQYIRTCAQFEKILGALQNSPDDNLKKAADNICNALRQTFDYKIQHIMDYTEESAIPELGSFLYDDVLTKVLETGDLEIYGLSAMCNLVGGITAFNAGAEIGSFIANAAFGSHDIFLRYFEMRAMAKIRDCLITEISTLDGSVTGPEDYQEIQNIQSYLYCLLYTCSRGEYCMYSLLEKDAKGTAVFSNIVDFFKGKEQKDRDEWYAAACDLVEYAKRNVDGMNLDIPEIQVSAMYNAYSQKIHEYENKYGTAQLNTVLGADRFSDMFFLSGVCFVNLINFGQTEQPDLLLVYSIPEMKVMEGNEFRFEIWRYEKDEMKLMDSDFLFGGDGGSRTLCITQHNGKNYLVTGSMDAFEYYNFHGQLDNQIGVVHEIEHGDPGDFPDTEYYIDGHSVTSEEYQTDEDQWLANARWYPLNGYIDQYNSMVELLQETYKTKQFIEDAYK